MVKKIICNTTIFNILASTILCNVSRLSTAAVTPQIQQQKQQKCITLAVQGNKISPLIFDKNLTLKFVSKIIIPNASVSI